jgi:hypothetical protein
VSFGVVGEITAVALFEVPEAFGILTCHPASDDAFRRFIDRVSPIFNPQSFRSYVELEGSHRSQDIVAAPPGPEYLHSSLFGELEEALVGFFNRILRKCSGAKLGIPVNFRGSFSLKVSPILMVP